MGQLAAGLGAAIFLAGIIYQSGRLSARVDALESWRLEVIVDLKAIRTTTDRISAILEREARP